MTRKSDSSVMSPERRGAKDAFFGTSLRARVPVKANEAGAFIFAAREDTSVGTRAPSYYYCPTSVTGEKVSRNT